MKIYLSLLFLLISCGKFNISPYEENISHKKYNQRSLELLDKKIPGTSIEVGLISDIHNNYDELKKFIKKENDLDFFIMSGDITNLGLNNEYELLNDQLKESKIPFFTAVGNHDLLNNGEKIFNKLFTYPNFSFDYGDNTFILINNNNWESSQNAYFDYNWLESKLISAKSNIFLISHIPYNDKDRFSQSEIIRMTDLVNKYKVKILINGHNHNHSVSYPEYFIHLTVGAINKGYYIKLKINEGDISFEKIYL